MAKSFRLLFVSPLFALALAVIIDAGPAFADWQAPASPSNVRGVAYSATAAELFWSASTDNTSQIRYRVYRGPSLIAELEGTSYFDNTLQPGTRFSYQVSAIDASGNESGRSPVLVIETHGAGPQSTHSATATDSIDNAAQGPQPGLTQPSPAETFQRPANLLGIMDQGRITLSWLGSGTTVAGYNIYQNDTYIDTVADTSYSTSVALHGSYEYYVVAFTGNGKFSEKSDPVSVTFAPQTTATQTTIPETTGTQTTATQSTATETTGATDSEATDSGATDENSNATLPVPTPSQPALPTDPPSVQETSNEIANDQAPNESEDPALPNQPDNALPRPPIAVASQTSPDGSIRLTWETADDRPVKGFNVYRNGNYLSTVFEPFFNDDTQSLVDEAAGDSALDPTRITYQVVAFDDAGNFSTLSLPASSIVENPLPESPEPIAAQSADGLSDGNPETAVPEPIDAYNSHLELDVPAVPLDGMPSVPRHFRVSLLSNDWVELDWTPASDDGAIVAYKIQRDDGVSYQITGDQFSPNLGRQHELNKYWTTTSFIDCNFTRFSASFHQCGENQPIPGERYRYTVSAIDDDGNESAPSNPVEVTFYTASGAPVEPYTDIYLNGDDRFPFDTDFSQVANFIDQFTLVFDDEFDGSKLNEENWNTSLTWSQSEVINGEQQYFVDILNDPDFGYDPFQFTGSSLLISAIPTPAALQDSALSMPFLSGALSSHNKFGMTYGYVEARMKVGDVPGMLSSFYLFRRWAAEHAPEIDIVEYLGDNPYGDEDAFATYHYHDPVNDQTRSSPTMFTAPQSGTRFGDDFHTYGVLWDPGLVIWYIDGQEVKRLSGSQIGRQEMNIVLYLVTGSDWTPPPVIETATAEGASVPLQFEIDYVRAWQREPYLR